MPAVSPCSMALGHRGSMRFSPLTASYPWAQSPAAYTSGSVVAQRPSTRMPRSTAPPASATSYVFGRTPTAVTSTSNSSSVPLWSRAVFPRNAAALSFR